MTKKPKQKQYSISSVVRQALLLPDASDVELRPDWSGKCEMCGQSPIVPVTGMCGPCTFGEADTIGGDW